MTIYYVKDYNYIEKSQIDQKENITDVSEISQEKYAWMFLIMFSFMQMW